MGEWKPIATAPRDGSWFVICRAGEPGSYEVGCYDPLMFPRYEDAGNGLFRKVEFLSYEWTGFNNMHSATHWQPLPSPPRAEEHDGGA